ncbi:MAG: hypothetical protein ACRDD8_09920 [Bacteroidales bacterium]
MDIDFAEKINFYLEQADFDAAIKEASEELQKCSNRKFDTALYINFDSQAESLAYWVEEYFIEINDDNKFNVLSIEMTDFSSETDTWHFDIFAYLRDGGLENTEWLDYYDPEIENEEVYPLLGCEDEEEIFEIYNILRDRNRLTDELVDAHDWAEQLIRAKAYKLIHLAKLKAKELDLEWCDIPLYIGTKDDDFRIKI